MSVTILYWASEIVVQCYSRGFEGTVKASRRENTEPALSVPWSIGGETRIPPRRASTAHPTGAHALSYSDILGEQAVWGTEGAYVAGSRV